MKFKCYHLRRLHQNLIYDVLISFQPKPEPSITKKKWKASQVYQRHTRKIDIASLISANPDPEYVSTRGRSVNFTPSGGTEGQDDASTKGGDGKGRGRGRRRGSTGPGKFNFYRNLASCALFYSGVAVSLFYCLV